ncbi:class I SAM-dependent methyltransferase [Anabaena azotica]|uniref:Class I SAM-dependent methyltransferase n=1 Tax=Anabaena azotica FACHB-119 TaxID=947527 RepID=A0ABR8DBR8_9NOST|nr:class I SAM-dependent methyltransferase [Anabaena azotica]MBD2504549.1 class I SAM-dependent methyltransferase [Anabaena azotica FACHB-119]
MHNKQANDMNLSINTSSLITTYKEVSPEIAAKLTGGDKTTYVRTLFDKISNRYDLIRTIVFLGHTSLWYRQSLSDLDLKVGDKVLDVGCGTGESTRYLINRYPGINVEGMDISSGMLNEARRLSPKVNYFEGDVSAIPCPNATYDFVLTTFTFRNFPERNVAIAEMLRVLRPGGRLLILDHFYPQNPLWRAVYTFWMRRVVPQIVKPFMEDVTPYRYLAESIINGLTISGFKTLLELNQAVVLQTNTYTGGAAGRVIAVCQQEDIE